MTHRNLFVKLHLPKITNLATEVFTVVSFLSLYFRQALHSWFEYEFLRDSKKMEAMRNWSGDAAAFLDKESVDRRILSSLCYEYGSGLTTRFDLTANHRFYAQDSEWRTKIDFLRKSAASLFWSHLPSLHALSTMKVKDGACSRTLRSLCTHSISKVISAKLKNGSAITRPYLKK